MVHLPPTHLLAKQSTLPLHWPDETKQLPMHTPPPAHSLERVHALASQPGRLLRHTAARLRHFSGMSAGSAPQQSADLVQSIWTHSLPLGVNPKLASSHSPRM